MSTAAALKRFGEPSESNAKHYMTMWVIPEELAKHLRHIKISVANQKGIRRIYCNVLLLKPLENAIKNLIATGKISEWKTYGGCFYIRKQRGGTKWSKHAWGLAIDLNEATNQLGAEPTLSPEFVKCFTDAGFIWGGKWARKDGMHFEINP